ncbi:HAD family hydrolase [Cellulomonas denverensis]|uniref:HAD family phosphatase n=1 Tax=Cellulomonas denverensis TaxID=264297 RepID=A0A7X6QY92_9CELL|nr:HAD family phosphatase [Cellulomonas denverensis]NKY21895.1 HAD family phosphatase [Cellulomonas denverensis]GIG24215.1 haloacid dehalogenase [Cellulomonas denverensis]
MTAVVFDLGNVLVGWDARAAFAGHYPEAQVSAFFEAVDFPALNLAQDAGRPWSVARDTIADPAHRAMLDHYLAHFDAALTGPVPGSAQIVTELVDAGVPVFGLTNWSAETYHHAVPAAPAIGLLADVLVSGREGLVKPDPRIFRLAAERFGVDPAGTVFVDDSPANVAAASAQGFDGLLFTGARDLRAALVQRGVLPRR